MFVWWEWEPLEVSLVDVDAEVGKYLSSSRCPRLLSSRQGSFKLALLKKGDLATAWFQCIDVNRQGHVQDPALMEGLAAGPVRSQWAPTF